MPRVFIVQEPMRKIEGEMVPQFDFRPAAVYGEPIVCLTSARTAMSPVPVIQRLREVLKDFGDEDFLVPTGDPAAIAIASAIVADVNRGRFNLLKWDNHIRGYIKVRINIHPHNEE